MVSKDRIVFDNSAVFHAACCAHGLTSSIERHFPDDWLQEIAEAIDLSPRATRTRLARLVVHGIVQEIGSGPQALNDAIFWL